MVAPVAPSSTSRSEIAIHLKNNGDFESPLLEMAFCVSADCAGH
jgi:hypothetical protein